VVRCRDEARVIELDEALWRAPEPVWLPHGTAKLGCAELQPVWIEAVPTGETPPNGATYLFLLDGVEAAADPFERVFDLFDGADEAAVAAARSRWVRLRDAGHQLTYWRQEAQGWHKAR
jgi:DNA polymerase-3 subunit chi